MKEVDVLLRDSGVASICNAERMIDFVVALADTEYRQCAKENPKRAAVFKKAKESLLEMLCAL